MADIFYRMAQIIGSEADWAANNLVLAAGEIGLAVQAADGSILGKIGDGTSTFSALEYTVGVKGVPYTGTTTLDPMTGPIVGPDTDYTTADEKTHTNLKYVDAQVALLLPLAGGTTTGPIVGPDTDFTLADVLTLTNKKYVDSLRTAVDAYGFQTAGYGGIAQSGTPALGNIEPVAFQTLPADIGAVASPRNVTQNTVTDSLSVDYAAPWLVNINISLSHTDVASDRTFTLRLWSIDQGVSSHSAVVGVARNSTVTNYSVTLLEDVVSPGDQYHIAIGDSSATIAGVVLTGYQFHMSMLAQSSITGPLAP